METVEEALNELEDLHHSILRSQENFKKCPKERLTKGYLESKIQCLDDYWHSFKLAHKNLLKLVPKKDQRKLLDYFNKDVFYSCEERYTTTKADMKDVLDLSTTPTVRPLETASTSSIQQHQEPQIKLPIIQIPVFSGNYEDWPTFQDMFLSLVHHTTSLSSVQKLQYLKSCVTGEAETLLKNIQVTNKNYELAWETLKGRYNNKRSILTSIMKRLFNQKKVQIQTAANIKTLHDVTYECINSLKNLDINVDSCDSFVIFLIAQKLDTETHKEWEEHVSKTVGDELPELSTLMTFLQTKFRTLELIAPSTSSNRDKLTVRSFHVSTDAKVCTLCKESHALYHCKEFGKMNERHRGEFVKDNKICFNCLCPGHSVKVCRLLTSCKRCKKRHHTLLHQSSNRSAQGQPSSEIQPRAQINEEETELRINTMMTPETYKPKNTISLLGTAVITVRSENGDTTVLRALIDPGSQGCLISERATQALKARRYPTKGNIIGVGSNISKIKQVVQIEIISRYQNNFSLKVKAYVISKQLTSKLPTKTISSHNWPHINGLFLADPNFYKPGPIDILLGVDEYAQILENDIIKGPTGTPCAQKSSLGWLLFGEVYSNQEDSSIVIMHQQIEVEDMLKTLWEVETDITRKLTKDEEECERFYDRTHSRNKDGKYIVKLPFNTNKPQSPEGNTREIALKRLQQLQRRLDRRPTLKSAYENVLEEYVKLNHMEVVPENEIHCRSVYLPHHAVLRADKDTTKVRVVFDASCKNAKGISLNDELLVGPVLQEDLRSIIMRWRTHKICFASDIEKMYRTILVHKADTDYQRILWYQRTPHGTEVKDFRLLTVTFGTASAPYLAVKTLMQIATDEGETYPIAARVIREDFYIDDLMSGCDTVEEAIETSKQLRTILRKGGMTLLKWSSNSQEFLRFIEPNERSVRANINIKLDGTVKALGLSWNLEEDAFQYKISLPTISNYLTKRTILSDLQKLFDPLGWIAPAIIQAKIFIQKLWLAGVQWDESVDDTLKEEWMKIRHDLQNVENITVKRWVGTLNSNKDHIFLHGFSDASIRAIAAVVYCRSKQVDGTYETSIIAARTKVAPVKTVSLPRLELCGAVLLSKLLRHVAQAMRIPANQVYAWTDSTIVLSWLFGEPRRWKPFIANRVVEILETVSSCQWYHVLSEHNPADIASRGTTITELRKNNLWWRGPSWLSDEKINFNRPVIPPTQLETRKTVQVNLNITEPEEKGFLNFENFESLKELKKIIVISKRVLNFRKYENSKNNFITTEELEDALNICIKRAQREDYNEEITTIKNKGRVKRNSTLKSLNPYIDKKGILKVGGRLCHSNMMEESKHPIILNNKNALTRLIVAEAHLTTLHGGLQLMLSHLRTRYWIVRAKNVIKQHIHKCLICAKVKAKARTQIMADLPTFRVNPSRPFLHSGVDFAGPYQILMSKGRGIRTSKAYIAIFICMATKAIHLELVGDLTSEAFLAAFRRFVARRGRCSHLYSDQGRNFVAANKELIDAWNEVNLTLSKDIADTLANDGTQWHFIPPYSPNFGGLWEAGVKSMKGHLKRILKTHLTYEEFTTLLCQVESCLNSRPLSPIDDTDAENLSPLTPGHFLIGEVPVTVPAPDVRQDKIGHLARWQHTQKLLRDFWHKWQQEYLSRLQQRPKWLKKESEFEVGEIVLIKHDNLPPGKWLMGRILNKHPGPDGVTRVYTIKSGDNVSKRCITKLCPLPIDYHMD